VNFLEAILGVAPDHGDGSLEFAVVIALFVILFLGKRLLEEKRNA
jgi:hypothetical protein